MGMFAGLRHISRSGVVPESAAMDFGLRCMLAASMAVGTILWGSRLAPVTGLQLVHTTDPAFVPSEQCAVPTWVWDAGVRLAKMTPFRSYTVMICTAGALAIWSITNQKHDTITYDIVSVCTCMHMSCRVRRNQR